MLIIDDNYDAVNYWAHTSNELLLQIFKSGSSLLANGNSNEKIEVAVNKWYRLRVSAVAPKAKPKTISFDGGSCTIYKIASDGVWNSANLTSYPGLSFELTGASRADFAIKCATVGNTSIKWGKITAATIETKNYTILGTGQSSTGNDVADLGEAPRRPNSLSWTESPCGEDCFYDVTLSKTQINGKPWDKDIPLKNIDYGKVYEWSISGSKKHPFHLHLYHMKIVTPGGCGAHKEGEFYDTISAPGDCEIQFKAIDIGQRMIMHCHVLSHEDMGAIHWINVTGTPNPNNINSPEYACCSSTTTITSLTTTLLAAKKFWTTGVNYYFYLFKNWPWYRHIINSFNLVL
mmetsp:Transcript_25599/g.38386  ORF Transcript_25599/g.38386 Transcript_25599/m.38386 type:complete len:347 (+) Transcript_25599:631-1671(+)